MILLFVLYCNVTEVNRSLQMKGFILQDAQVSINSGILLSSLARKVDSSDQHPSMLIFKTSSPFYTKGYHLYPTTLPPLDYFPRKLIFIFLSELKGYGAYGSFLLFFL